MAENCSLGGHYGIYYLKIVFNEELVIL